jgi:hypothetical protein
MGHPASPIVTQIIKSNKLPMTSSKLSSVCSSCQQGKSHRLHFSYSPSISSNPLQLLFIDVWDPTSITSVNNNCFYLSIVDDFSKYTRFYPLKLKSDVCAIFLHFKQLVETYFGTKIISVQSDNGGEFRPLQTSLTAMGVSYRLSCPHTHHQMESVERKHRHIVETGLSLLAIASVPFTFWDSAFETAVYLINRLPSKVTKHKSPFESLFQISPDYKFLKVFGCECWPSFAHIISPNLPSGLIRVFLLGISRIILDTSVSIFHLVESTLLGMSSLMSKTFPSQHPFQTNLLIPLPFIPVSLSLLFNHQTPELMPPAAPL